MLLPLAAIVWLGTIAAVGLWAAPWWLPAIPVASVAIAAAIGWRRSMAAGAMMVALSLIAGHTYHEWQTRPPLDLLRSTGHPVQIVGTVDSDPQRGSTSITYIIDVTEVRDREGVPRRTEGKVQVVLGQYDHMERGATVTLSGEISRPFNFGDFDYREYLLRRDIVGLMRAPRVDRAEAPWRFNGWRMISRGRERLGGSLSQALPEPEASLARGILLGDDSGMPNDLKENFRRSGLSHIVAVSGSNLSILTALALAVLVPMMGIHWARWAVAVAICLYVPLTGGEASVVRAAIMAGCLLTAGWTGRQVNALPALGLAVIVMSFLDPAVVEDVGFQLSVTATAGIVVLAPWIAFGLDWAAQHARVERVVPQPLIEMASFSLAASLATLPITWDVFGRVSLVGPLLNMVVDPLFAIAFGFSMAIAAAGLAAEPVGRAVGLLGYYALAFITLMAREAGSVDAASIDTPSVGRGWTAAAMAALGLAGAAAYLRRPPSLAHHGTFGARLRPGYHVAAVGLFCSLLLMADVFVRRQPLRDGTTVSIFAMDHGDAILVTTAHGSRVLIDGGGSGLDAVRRLDEDLPHWERRLDRSIVTSGDLSQAGALRLVNERYDLRAVAGLSGTNGTAEPAPEPAADPSTFEFDGVLFEQIALRYPKRTSGARPMTQAWRITAGGAHILVALDLDATLIAALEAAGALHNEVVVTDTASQALLKSKELAAISPQVVVVTSKASRPNPADGENSAKAAVVRTVWAGTIRLRLRTGLRVETERGASRTE